MVGPPRSSMPPHVALLTLLPAWPQQRAFRVATSARRCAHRHPSLLRAARHAWLAVLVVGVRTADAQSFAPPPSPPPSPSPPTAVTQGMVAWHDAAVNFATGSTSWPDTTSGASATASVTAGVALATDAAGAAGNACPVTYLRGTVAQAINFSATVSALPFSICSVTRYTGIANQQRILQSRTTNAAHGHWSGQAGSIFYAQWAAAGTIHTGSVVGGAMYSPVAPNTNWMVTCAAVSSATAATVYINGDASITDLFGRDRAGGAWRAEHQPGCERRREQRLWHRGGNGVEPRAERQRAV